MKNIARISILIIFVLGIFTVLGNIALAASPTIISSKATSIKTDVTLEGLVNPNGYLTTAWFEYGTSKSLTNFNETTHVTIGSATYGSPFGSNISNLIPNTTYYFRVVADNGRGTIKGSIASFATKVTENSEAVNKINKPEVVIIESKSKILKIVTSQNDVFISQEIDYFVTFNNTTEENLKNVKITVELPEGVDFVESDLGKEENGNIITYSPGILFSSEFGSIKIKGVVNSKAIGKEMLIATAVISYTNESGLEVNEITNSINNVIRESTGLEASPVLGGENFLPSTLTDWLILVLVVMCLIVVGRLMYKGNSIGVLKDL